MPFRTLFARAGRRIFVAGRNGMVGSASCRRLAGERCTLLTAERTELDLLDQTATFAWFDRHRPEVVVMAAARVGGILANDRFPASFRALTEMVCDAVGFAGAIECDTSKPDGTPRKLMCNERLRTLGWGPTIPLQDGIAHAYAAYLAGEGRVRPMTT